MNAYISYLLHENPITDSNSPPLPVTSTKGYSIGAPDPNIALVCIGGSGDFEHIKGWCETVTKVIDIFNASVLDY